MSDHTSYHDYDTLPYIVIDLETSVKNKGETVIGGMAASPFHPDNTIVLGGLKAPDLEDGEPTIINIFLTGPADRLTSRHIFVGHNIKFDLLYFFKRYNGDKDIVDWLLNKVLIWDTMVVEYLITGQQDKFTSLDVLSKKYGGTLKDSNIKKYWEDGVDTEDIPQEELKEYLIEDLKNTELVYLKQKEQVARMKGMLPLIYMEMESIKDTILAEWNGMYVSINRLGENAQWIHKELLKVETSLKMVNPDINWSSPVQLQAFLFGGKVKVGFKDEPTGEVYKTGAKKGMMKTKKVPFEPEYPGYLKSTNPEYNLTYNDTSEESLKHSYMIIEGTKMLWAPHWASQLWLIKQIQLYRKLYKDFNTYYAGIAKLVWPNDSCVHANFNHCATDTGRLSCSSPNLQNITSKE